MSKLSTLFKKYQTAIIVGTAIFVVAYAKGLLNNIPLFTGSLFGGGALGQFSTISFVAFGLAVALLVISPATGFLSVIPAVGLFWVAVTSFGVGSIANLFDSLIRNSPVTAIIIGLVIVFVISRVFLGGRRSTPSIKIG